MTTVLLVVGFSGAMFIVGASLDRLEVELEADGAVSFRANDGPYVITHVVYSSPGGPIEKVAALEPPIAFVESGRQTLSAAKISTLKWETYRGQPTTPPKPGSKLRAIYQKGRLSSR